MNNALLVKKKSHPNVDGFMWELWMQNRELLELLSENNITNAINTALVSLLALKVDKLTIANNNRSSNSNSTEVNKCNSAYDYIKGRSAKEIVNHSKESKNNSSSSSSNSGHGSNFSQSSKHQNIDFQGLQVDHIMKPGDISGIIKGNPELLEKKRENDLKELRKDKK
jgi:hypothetical protein